DLGYTQQTNLPGVGSQTECSHGVNCNNEPIYSEIEDDSLHVLESPNLENSTGIQHFNLKDNPNVLYALVDKSNKNSQSNNCQQQYSGYLEQIQHDSLKAKRNTQKIPTLSPLPEPSGGEVTSYSSPSLFESQLMDYKSLNNVRVMENHSPPKRQRNLSKSDLSLHRSEFFLDNLCRSHAILDSHSFCIGEQNLQKIENNNPRLPSLHGGQTSSKDTPEENEGYIAHNDAVSYELPAEEVYHISDPDSVDSVNVCNTISPPLSNNQSTPKKPSFTSKEKTCALVEVVKCPKMEHLSSSCPNTPNKLIEMKTPKNNSICSFDTVLDTKSNSTNSQSSKVLPSLRSALNKSLRKSKDFIKRETRKIPKSLSFKRSQSEDFANKCKNKTYCRNLTVGTSIDLDHLLSVSQSPSICDQLVHVVNICRSLPESKISSEMVEAERLLLFSTLRRESQGISWPNHFNREIESSTKKYIFIDEMLLPIREDPTRDIFFNYFYIVTFECGGIIRSSQSAECQNGLAIFRDCGIEFMLHSDKIKEHETAVKCKIFMLRLRKVSCLTTETNKMKFKELKGSSSGKSSSSSIDIVSRFRFQASFTLTTKDFIPFNIVSHESIMSDRIYLRSSKACNIVLSSSSTSSNLLEEIQVKGRSELRIPTNIYAGYLNVEDPNVKHNWNRRWCTLDGIRMQIWRGENVL
uniref:PH domain-containing protein n=1 Tax=Musca domestica TaxID=7370 RepID=A0A1I8N9B2_MUSDO